MSVSYVTKFLLVTLILAIAITYVARLRDQRQYYSTASVVASEALVLSYAPQAEATAEALILLPEPMAEPEPEPAPQPVSAAALSPHVEALPALPPLPTACHDHPDRFNWQKYALAVGFPQDVVDGELAKIVQAESTGDLCAVNSSSGATCWIQQLPGGPQFFDPISCMSQGYSKWVDGGRNYPDRSPFWQHWYQWWER